MCGGSWLPWLPANSQTWEGAGGEWVGVSQELRAMCVRLFLWCVCWDGTGAMGGGGAEILA